VALTLGLVVGCGTLPTSGNRSGRGDGVELTRARDYVNRQIVDPNRSAVLLGMIESAETQIEALNQLHEETEKQWHELQRDPTVTGDRLRSFLDSADRRRLPFRDSLANTLVAMKDVTTPAEWQALANLKTEDILQSLKHASAGAGGA
jgi:hypothetical protein